jgi:hypothetical protein
LQEAVDDKGQSLLPRPNSPNMVRHMAYANYGYNAGGQMLQLSGNLKLPDQPGRSIARLRGLVPLSIAARKSDPLIIPLGDAKGKTFVAGDTSVVIHDVTKPNNGNGGGFNNPMQGTLLDLTIRFPTQTPGGNGFGVNGFGAPGVNPQNQIEVVDDKDRLVFWNQQSTNIQPGQMRLTLNLMNHGNAGPPARLRFYDLARAKTEASFEFHDVPLP